MKAAAALVLVVLAAANAPSAHAGAGRIAVGVAEGVPTDQVAFAVWEAVGQPIDRALDPLGALVVTVDDVEAVLPVLGAVDGVEYVEPIERTRSIAFVPNDPLATIQWYLQAIRAFDSWPEPPTGMTPVRVAVVDSGIDRGHPEFVGRIVDTVSFVTSRPDEDKLGHGTFVAGEIAALTNNLDGIAGVGLPVELLIAKVVGADGNISIEAEAKAIRWAVDKGARVINLSLGGKRAPNDPGEDTYSALEEAAIEYATSRNVAVVAASGNCDATCPYPFASYPAALSHVIGVGAVAVDGSVPQFSNRDRLFVDVSAPGIGIVSTFPRELSNDPGCGHPGYSICATSPDYRDGAGTSFAAPLVTAAVALAISVDPSLSPGQIAGLVARTARDVGRPGRDAATGSGELDVVNLLQAVGLPPLPLADSLESNDDAGERAATVALRRSRTIDATIDAFDDPSDVYRVYLRRGVVMTASLTGSLGGKATLVLWRPGTQHVAPVTTVAVRSGAIMAWRKGARPVLRALIDRPGWYYVEVKSPPRSGGSYRLTLEARRPV